MKTHFKRGTLALAAAVVSLALFPARSYGWGNTWLGANLERIVNAARWKLGFLRYNAGFQLGNVGYDSDIYFGSTRDRIPDYTFSAMPNVHFYLPLKKGIVLDIAEAPQYMFYLKTKAERAWNNSFWVQAHFALDRLYFAVGGGLIKARERLSTELNLYVGRKESDLQGLAFWQISKGSAVSLQFKFAEHEYENPTDGSIDIQENLNRTERLLNLTVYLLQISRTRVYLDAEYGSFALGDARSSYRNSRSYGVYGGVEFLPPPEGGAQSRGFQGRINLGYRRFDLLDPRLKDFEGLVGNTSISFMISPFTTLRGGYVRNTQFSVYSDLGYYFQTGYGGGISQALTKRILLSYDLSLSRNDYQMIMDGGPAGVNPIKYNIHTLGLGVRLGENLGLQVTASLSDRKSAPLEPVFRRHTISFSLTYGPSSGGPALSASPFSR